MPISTSFCWENSSIGFQARHWTPAAKNFYSMSPLRPLLPTLNLTDRIALTLGGRTCPDSECARLGSVRACRPLQLCRTSPVCPSDARWRCD
jgi:hypothetical protein